MAAAQEIITLEQGALARKQDWMQLRDMLVAESQAIATVESDADLAHAGKVQTAIGKHIRALEKERKALTTPVDAWKRDIMRQEKEMRADLEAQQSRIKRLNDSYVTAQEIERRKAEQARREAEERARIAEAAKQMEAEELFGEGATVREDVAPTTPAPPPPPPAPPKPRTDDNRIVTRWSFEVIDSAQVPREYLSVDEKKIRAYMQYQTKLGNDPEIPGVKFEAHQSVEGR